MAYVAGAMFFMALDYFQRPHFLYKYKINPGKNAPPPLKKVIKVRKYNVDHEKVWASLMQGLKLFSSSIIVNVR